MFPIIKNNGSMIFFSSKFIPLIGIFIVIHEANMKADVPLICRKFNPSIFSIWYLEYC